MELNFVHVDNPLFHVVDELQKNLDKFYIVVGGWTYFVNVKLMCRYVDEPILLKSSLCVYTVWDEESIRNC